MPLQPASESVLHDLVRGVAGKQVLSEGVGEVQVEVSGGERVMHGVGAGQHTLQVPDAGYWRLQ